MGGFKGFPGTGHNKTGPTEQDGTGDDPILDRSSPPLDDYTGTYAVPNTTQRPHRWPFYTPAT